MLNPNPRDNASGHSPAGTSTFTTPSLRADTRQRIDSLGLLGGGRELVIDHAGQEYRLRLTRNDKLILTK